IARLATRKLPVTDPMLANAILAGTRNGKLSQLAREDCDYLLSCYLAAYGDLLDHTGSADRHSMLPVLCEFAAIAQILGPTAYSSSILQRWTNRGQRKPRALTHFSDEEAFDAPLRGVGSPNGISVTVYHADHVTAPVRIAYAGLTGDRTLN